MESLGVHGWSRHPIRLVDWPAGRHSLRAQAQWRRVNRAVGDAVWFFPHWDAPWYSLPRRYVATVYDLTLIRVRGATTNSRRHVTEWWMKNTVCHASRIVVPSHYTARDLAALVPQAAERNAAWCRLVWTRAFSPCPLRCRTPSSASSKPDPAC